MSVGLVPLLFSVSPRGQRSVHRDDAPHLFPPKHPRQRKVFPWLSTSPSTQLSPLILLRCKRGHWSLSRALPALPFPFSRRDKDGLYAQHSRGLELALICSLQTAPKSAQAVGEQWGRNELCSRLEGQELQQQPQSSSCPVLQPAL